MHRLLLFLLCLAVIDRASAKTTFKEYEQVFTTYPYSDPDPVPVMSRFYPYFRYALGAKGNLAAAGDWTGGIGAGVDYTMFHVALGAAADNFSKAATTGLSHVVAKLAANPVAGAEVGGIAYMAMASSNPSPASTSTAPTSLALPSLGPATLSAERTRLAFRWTATTITS